MTQFQLQVIMIALIIVVFAVYTSVMQNGLRSHLARLMKGFVEAELIYHPGLSKQTLLEAIVHEQMSFGALTKAEGSFILKTVRYDAAN